MFDISEACIKFGHEWSGDKYKERDAKFLFFKYKKKIPYRVCYQCGAYLIPCGEEWVLDELRKEEER
jgi:hypothetical protein